MNNFINSLVALCIGVLSSWHFPGVLGFSDHGHDNQNDHKHLELRINGKDDPKKIINFADLKPGDHPAVVTDLWVSQDAKVYLHITDLVSSQGAQTDPEIKEESIIGPKYDLQDYLTYNLSAADISNLPFPDVVSCFIPVGDLKANHHLSLNQVFYFSSSVTNWAQGDRLIFAEEFFAADPTAPPPDSGSGRIWDSLHKTCITKPTPTPTQRPTPIPTKKPKKDHD